MLRIRKRNGDVIVLNGDNVFVELCDKDGNIVSVFYEKQDNGEIYQLDADSPNESKHYESLFDVNFIKKKFAHPG